VIPPCRAGGRFRSTLGQRLARAGASLALILSNAPAFGQALSLVHEFSARGGRPLSGLIQASDGKLYGVLSSGGEGGDGSVYSLTPDGMGGYAYAEVYAATADDNVVIFSGGLLEAADGGLYGATIDPDYGAIYRVDPAGTFAVVHRFTSAEGSYPSPLIQPSGGDFYGVTGTGNGGTPFAWTRAAT